MSKKLHWKDAVTGEHYSTVATREAVQLARLMGYIPVSPEDKDRAERLLHGTP